MMPAMPPLMILGTMEKVCGWGIGAAAALGTAPVTAAPSVVGTVAVVSAEDSDVIVADGEAAADVIVVVTATDEAAVLVN